MVRNGVGRIKSRGRLPLALVRPGVVVIALLFLLVLATSAALSQGPHLPEGGRQAEVGPLAADPCLNGDPYNLAQLVTLLSATDPPTGTQRINPTLSLEWIGRGHLVEAAPAPLPEESEGDGDTEPVEPQVDETDFRVMEMRVFNSRTLNEFELIMDQPMLDDIRNCHEDNGLTRGTEGFDSLDDIEAIRKLFLPLIFRDSSSGQAGQPVEPYAPLQPFGWSNGVDTRIIRTPTTLWPWRSINQFRYGNSQQSGCSATLIGPRHLITAAHCINEKGTNNWYTFRATPAKNGPGVEPYGSSVVSTSPAPGTEVWYFTPAPWRNPATASSQWDWGLIVIPDRLGDLTGWMGYVARPGSQLKQVSNYNRGYPHCDVADRDNEPAGCQVARLYGDTQLCNIGGFYSPGPDGWNRRIAVSCDLSAGHSGSPVYHYFFDANLGKYWPVVSMVVITESCTKCGPLDFYPNRARRITPGDLGTISWLRETFP